jgi:hypothetical protein
LCARRRVFGKLDRNRREQRGRSNLGEPPAPPLPWQPWNRGETLLPSREEVKEEEEGGGLSPPLCRWRRNAAGAIIVTAIYTNNFAAVITNSLPSMQRFNTPSPRCNLYLNMVLNAIYYFPMMDGYPMMFE